MTTKQINLLDKKPVNQIEKGAIVKKSGDMFIVAKISEAQFTTAVDEALFGSGYSYDSSRHKSRSVSTYAVRNPAEAKYVLISLSTGAKFYQEFLTLPELLSRISREGFEVVSKIQIQELY